MSTKVDILLVEDNKRDAELIAEALKESLTPHTLTLATDGEEALRILQQFQPHVVFLDLNLPRVSGLDVLRQIRQSPALRSLPVIILTNSRSQEDVQTCYDEFCNAYIRKPLGFDRITEVLTATSAFWFKVATLPKPFPILVSLPPSSGSSEKPT